MEWKELSARAATLDKAAAAQAEFARGEEQRTQGRSAFSSGVDAYAVEEHHEGEADNEQQHQHRRVRLAAL
jgi:hypothetical protein